MKKLMTEWRKQLKEFEMTGLSPGAYTPGAAEEPSADQTIDAGAYLAKIKGGQLDAWNDLRSAMEGDMAGLPKGLMDETQARELVLDIADLMASELSGGQH
jgi:hypothetical protein